MRPHNLRGAGVIKNGSKSSTRRITRRQPLLEHDSDAPNAADAWYSDVFGDNDPYWQPSLLSLARRYIGHHLRHDVPSLRLGRRLLGYLSSLVLRCGFRAKLQHIHRDVNDVVKVLRVPPRLHSALALEARHGFSVFPGICFKGHLSHPRMFRDIGSCKVVLAEKFHSGTTSKLSGDYEDMREVIDVLESVDAQIDRLTRSGVKLLLCGDSVSLDVGQKLHLRGITCLSKVDSSVLSQVALALDVPVVESLERCPGCSTYVGHIERLSFVQNAGENIAALSLNANFHGCSILYSTTRLTPANALRLSELLRMSLFRLQGLFEELVLVRDLGGRLDSDLPSCFLPVVVRGVGSRHPAFAFDQVPRSRSFSTASNVYSRHSSNLASDVDFMSGASASASPRDLRDDRRGSRLRKFMYLVKGHRPQYMSKPSKSSSSGARQLCVHFSDWLSHYLHGTMLASGEGPSVQSRADLEEHSALRCFQYFTKSSEMCGSVTPSVVPVGRYSAGLFLSDFVVAYERRLRHNACISSEECADQLSRHHLHLETSDSPASGVHKRLSIIVHHRSVGITSGSLSPPYLLSIHCRTCDSADTLSVHDLTFGRFLHLLLYNSCYVAKCGHALFAGHAFSLRGEGFTLCLHVKDVSDFHVGAWFDAPLLNCGLGFLPLDSAGLSFQDRRLSHVSAKLSRIFANFSEAAFDWEPSYNVAATPDSVLSRDYPTEPSYSWAPYDTSDLNLLHLRDPYTMLSVALRNLLNMLIGYMDSQFAACVSGGGLDEALPCRCEFGATLNCRKLDPRNQWSGPFSAESFAQLRQLFEDRSVFGVDLHPLLRDALKGTYESRQRFGFCERCQQVKFASIADIEILNWVQIFTEVLRYLAVKLRGLSDILGSIMDATTSSTGADCGVGMGASPAVTKTENRCHTRTATVADGNKSLKSAVGFIEDCLEGLRDTYVQCVSHLLFAHFWCSLDPMHIFMTVRCFFVSLTSLCRSVVQRIVRTSDPALLKSLHFSHRGSGVVLHTADKAYPTPFCDPCPVNQREPGSEEASATEPSPALGSSDAGSQLEDGIDFATDTERGVDPAKPMSQTEVSSDPHGNTSDHLPEEDTPRASRGAPVDPTNSSPNSDWCTVWGTQIALEHLQPVSYPAETHAGDQLNGPFAPLPQAAPSAQSSREYTLPQFVQHALNAAVLFGFVGRAEAKPSAAASLRHLMARMHAGCPRRAESLIGVSYGLVCQVRRDIGNIIATGLMSGEYLEQCAANFHRPVSGNLCRMGMSLLNYCKNKRYNLTAAMSAGPRRDDFYGFSAAAADPPSSKDGRCFGGLITTSFVFRYLKRHSHVASLFSADAHCVFQSAEVATRNVFSLRRWDAPHSSLATSPWGAMASSDAELSEANLSCYWQAAKVVGAAAGSPHRRDGQRVLCPVSRPACGTPLICCNHRLFRYRWCNHVKDFGAMPVMDRVVKMLLANLPTEGQALRTLVEWTYRNLQASCVRRISTNTLLAYVTLETERISMRECGSVAAADGYAQPVFHSLGAFAPRGTPCSPFALESPSETRSPQNATWFQRGFPPNHGSRPSLLAMPSVAVTLASKGDSAFNRSSLPPASELSLCPALTLTAAHPSYHITAHYPEAFHALRHLSSGDDVGFARSLCRSSRIRCSGGKSGAPLFVSHDGKFVLKLLNKYEFQLFLDRGPRFFGHVMGGGTLLSVPYGLFSIEHKRSGSAVHCLVMQNVEHALAAPRLTFDLKGLSFKRCVSLSPGKPHGGSPPAAGVSTFHCCSAHHDSEFPDDVVLLDQNFKDFTDGCPIRVGEPCLSRLLAYVERDLAFLAHLDVVDYSLLLRLFPAAGVLVLGIIDYLRPYTWDKQIETIGKKLANLASGQAPTIVSPSEYQTRFMRFFTRSFWLLAEERPSPPAPASAPEPARRPPARCRCSACAALDALYSTPFATSSAHFMWRTSPTAKRYLRRLAAASAPCDSAESAAAELARALRSAYGVPALDGAYRGM